MSDSVYKVIELVGSSETSWEEAAKKQMRGYGELRKYSQTANLLIIQNSRKTIKINLVL